jgi:lipopolysaccharide export system protein LptC
MEKKNDYTILLLVAAGLGIYWLYKKQSVPPATTTLPADQTPISTNPVANVGYDVKYVINGMRKLSSVPNTI